MTAVCRALAAAALLTVAACSSSTVTAPPPPSVPVTPVPSTSTAAPTTSPTPTATATTAPPATVTVAFGGDSHTHGAAGRVFDTGLGGVGRALAAADLAMVNVETVIAADEGGLQPQPKEYTFLAPPSFLDLLKRTGVDVVTLANNHGLDFGREGLNRTLAELTPRRPVALGLGADVEAAFRPWRTTVRGRGVVFFAATDVMDDGFDWTATGSRSGMASIKTDAGYRRLREAVRAARRANPTDVLAVYLHAGVERVRCPSARQRQVATDLAADGADAVVMSHAHILQPFEVRGRTAVAYGLGNFLFASRGESVATGVLRLTFPPSGPPKAGWAPARIVAGVPQLLTGAAAAAAVRAWRGLGAGC